MFTEILLYICITNGALPGAQIAKELTEQSILLLYHHPLDCPFAIREGGVEIFTRKLLIGSDRARFSSRYI